MALDCAFRTIDGDKNSNLFLILFFRGALFYLWWGYFTFDS